MDSQIDLHANLDHLHFLVVDSQMLVEDRTRLHSMLRLGRPGYRCDSISWRESRLPRVRRGSVSSLGVRPYFERDGPQLKVMGLHLCTDSVGIGRSTES